MNSLDSYFKALGYTAKQAAAVDPIDAYFGSANDKTAAPADPALAAYLEGFGKQADGLMDMSLGQMGNAAWNGITGGASSAGHGVADFARGVGDHAMGGLSLAGNGLAAIPRSLAAQAASLSGGGTLGDAAQEGTREGFTPVANSFDRMIHGSPTPGSSAPSPASVAITPARPFADPPVGAHPTGTLAAPTPTANRPPTLPGVAPEIAGMNPPAPTPAPAAPTAPAPAAPQHPPTYAGAITADHLANFKKQTGTAYNPHSIADRMAMAGFQKGFTGAQAQQVSSLANRKQISPDAGTAAGNTAMVNALDRNPSAVAINKLHPMPPAMGALPAAPQPLTAAR